MDIWSKYWRFKGFNQNLEDFAENLQNNGPNLEDFGQNLKDICDLDDFGQDIKDLGHIFKNNVCYLLGIMTKLFEIMTKKY